MNEQSHLQIIAKKMIHIKMIENFYKKKIFAYKFLLLEKYMILNYYVLFNSTYS